MFNVVTTLAPSSLIGSSSFLLVMRTMHKSLDKVLGFRLNPNADYGISCIRTSEKSLSLSLSFANERHLLELELAGNEEMHFSWLREFLSEQK